jgi:DNA-binding CsgD family transcriptional regulator
LGDKIIAPESLEGLACIAASEGEVERAAKLFAAAQALREAVGYRHAPEEEALREPYLATTRSQVGEVAWEEALAQGRAIGLEEAIEYALSEEEERETPTLVAVLEQYPPLGDRAQLLTAREQEVALLVVQGLTNRQIAKQLVLSERTIDHHVSRILRKLNVGSRERVASRLNEH